MYILTRKRDNLVHRMKYFGSIRYRMDGNITTPFPPKLNDGVIVYNSISDGRRTTLVESVEKVSENEYNFRTENSLYNIKRVGNDI